MLFYHPTYLKRKNAYFEVILKSNGMYAIKHHCYPKMKILHEKFSSRLKKHHCGLENDLRLESYDTQNEWGA